MKKFLFTILTLALFAVPVSAASLGQSLAGKILLQVEEHGEAWYIHPMQFNRYYLKDGDAAYTIMRFLSLGISDADLALIPTVADTSEMNASTSICASNSLANRLKGNILLQVEQNGEAWYVDVDKCRRIYLRDGQAAYDVMRFLGLGITNTDLTSITIAQDSALPEGVEPPPLPPAAVGVHEVRTITANGQDFKVDLVTIDLTNQDIEVITDSANDMDCDTNCIAQSLEQFVIDNAGSTAIHGSYFCPISYSGCAGQTNYFFFPVYDSDSGNFINEDQLLFPTTGPLWIFDEENEIHVLKSTIEFGSVAEFEQANNIQIQAAIGNLPLLIHAGDNIVGSQELDDKQRNTKSTRGGIAVTDEGILYLMIAHAATVVDLAFIMESLQVEYGMNLDGGGSSALYHGGEYKVGPGRAIPNAIIFK